MLGVKVFVCALLSFAAVNALPPRGLYEDVSSAWHEATHDVASQWGKATLAVASAASSIRMEESATSLYESATEILGSQTSRVYATMTTISGMPIVEVTSVGGKAITLATGTATGSGVHVKTTTFAGHTFAINAAAPRMQPFAISAPMLASAAAVLGSVAAGAFVLL